MKQYSATFITALLSMSLITQAYAETNVLTPEQIERMYIDEVKVAGKTLQCFQAGQEIIHEVGLQNVEETSVRITAKRLDGSMFEVLLFEGTEMACTIITRYASE